MPKRRILVVEDEEKIRRLFKTALEPSYSVVAARDGKEGLALAQLTQPDMILLDLRLPKLDGYMVLRALKMSAKTANIPVVIISAVSASGSLLDASSLGASDYLIKPIELSEVRDVVRRYVVS